MLSFNYYDVFTDVEVISPSGHVLLVGVFAVCRYSNNISLGVGCHIHLKTVS